MGRKFLWGTFGLSGAATLVNLIAIVSPFHKVEFSVVLVFFRVTTYSLRVYVDFEESVVCSGVFRHSTVKDFCKYWKESDSSELEDISLRMCSPAAMAAVPHACQGLRNAYGVGMAIVFCTVINIILSGTAAALLYHYLMEAPKKKYREVALALLTCGAMLSFILIGAYAPAVLHFLDDMGGPLSGCCSSSHATSGVSWGYILLWMGWLLQVIVVGLAYMVKSNQEAQFLDARERMRFEMEMGSYPQNAGAPMHGQYPQVQYPQQQAPCSYDPTVGSTAASTHGGYDAGFVGGGAVFRSSPEWKGHSMRVDQPPAGWGSGWGAPQPQPWGQPQAVITTVTVEQPQPQPQPMGPPYF